MQRGLSGRELYSDSLLYLRKSNVVASPLLTMLRVNIDLSGLLILVTLEKESLIGKCNVLWCVPALVGVHWDRWCWCCCCRVLWVEHYLHRLDTLLDWMLLASLDAAESIIVMIFKYWALIDEGITILIEYHQLALFIDFSIFLLISVMRIPLFIVSILLRIKLNLLHILFIKNIVWCGYLQIIFHHISCCEYVAGPFPRWLLQTHYFFTLYYLFITVSRLYTSELTHCLSLIVVCIHRQRRLLILCGFERAYFFLIFNIITTAPSSGSRIHQQQRGLSQVESLACLRMVNILILIYVVRTQHIEVLGRSGTLLGCGNLLWATHIESLLLMLIIGGDLNHDLRVR